MMADEKREEPPPVVTVFGRTGSPHCYAVRDFMHGNDVPFEWIEPHSDDARAIGLGGLEDDRLPVRVFDDETRMALPEVQSLSEKLGLLRDQSSTD